MITVAAREVLLASAYRRMRFPNMYVEADVRAASALDGGELAEAFGELMSALAERDRLGEHDPASEAAAVRVEDALDSLLGEARDG